MPETVVLFHSGLGLRPSVHSFAEELRRDGHLVHTPDLYDGEVFSSLEEGARKRDRLGIPTLIERAWTAVSELPADIVYAGFSMGAAPAQLLAATRGGARAAVLMHGALPLEMIGVEAWPGVPVQIHFAEEDTMVDREHVDALTRAVVRSGPRCDVHSYPGEGHLFADVELPEFDEGAARSMSERVRSFLRSLAGAAP